MNSNLKFVKCIREKNFIDDKNSLWYGKKLHALYKLAYTPWEWHVPIIKLKNETQINEMRKVSG